MAGLLGPGGPFTEIDRLRTLVGRHFTIYETRTTPYSLIFLVNVIPQTLENNFNELAREMWPLYYIPQIRLEQGEHFIEVVRRPRRKAYGVVVNWVMLALTLVTTLFAGAFLWVSYEGNQSLGISDFLWGGIFFAVPLLAILGLHELAHFLMARRHKVEASLPFFLPMPPPIVIFGTFGAFISLREPIPNRKALFDIGVSGPLVGFAVAIPITLAGFVLSAHSPVLPLSNCGPVFLSIPYGNLVLGSSIIWWFLSLFFPVGFENLNPLAIAGWVGLLITSINLLPAGQLDGGHVFRALLGRRSSWLSVTAVVVLLVFGLFYPGWIFFAILVLLLGVRHPPPLNDLTPLDLRRKALGVGAALVLIGGFAFIPIASPTGAYSLENVTMSKYQVNETNANLTFRLVNNDIVAHAFPLTLVIVLLSYMNNSTTQQFDAGFSWSLTYSGSGGQGNLSGNAFTISLPTTLNLSAGGGSVFVALHVTDPMPVHFSTTIQVSELCSGVQNLPQGKATAYLVQY